MYAEFLRMIRRKSKPGEKGIREWAGCLGRGQHRAGSCPSEIRSTWKPSCGPYRPADAGHEDRTGPQEGQGVRGRPRGPGDPSTWMPSAVQKTRACSQPILEKCLPNPHPTGTDARHKADPGLAWKGVTSVPQLTR